MFGDMGHFDLNKGSSGLSRGAEGLLLKIYGSKRLHYKNCCGQEVQVHELVGKNFARIDRSFYLSLTTSGQEMAKRLSVGGGDLGFFRL